MKERPILMSGEMVRATLDGRKTMTRRIMRPAKEIDRGTYLHRLAAFARELGYGLPGMADEPQKNLKCPYGQIGDRLWVRESGVITKPYSIDHKGPWITFKDGCQKFFMGSYLPATRDPETNWWKKQGHKLTPSIHIPKWASRITLEITNIRVERLQDISEEDAKKEGVDISHLMHPGGFLKTANPPHRTAFAGLWKKINGKKYPWSLNPYVWVIEFKRIKP